MDLLDEIATYLTSDERAEFKNFIHRLGKTGKDMKLFDLVTEENKLTSVEIQSRLYQPLNQNAYHSLRKRLVKRLFEFIVLKRLETDASKTSTVMGMLSVGQFMLEKGAPKITARFLKKAEQLATRSRRHDMLEAIYNFQITHAEALEIHLDILKIKWQENAARYESFRKLNFAHAIIRQQLAAAKKSGGILDPEAIIDSVFRDFDLSREEANNPAFLYRIITMARSALVSAKDYHRLEHFIVRIYTRLKSTGAFGKGDLDYELGFVFMIAHTLYRNRKFGEAGTWLDRMTEMLPLRSFRATSYYPKYISLTAAIASFSGKNHAAIELMESVLTQKSGVTDVSERINMQLNLAVFYFQAEEYKKANKMIRSIGHADKWLEENMGKEWRFKRDMIELIVQYELGNDDIALTMLRKLQVYFSEFLNHPAYQRAKLFLRFIQRMMNNPEDVTSAEFRQDVKSASMGWEGYKEDIQAITFFCWLKSKMVKRKYYEVLVEQLNEE